MKKRTNLIARVYNQLTFLKPGIRYWELLSQFTRRDIASRYKGSQLGMAWTVINPILMLSVYTLVFSKIFRARWGTNNADQGPLHFALNLFAGLIVFNIFAECATRAPMLISSNPNYVKKILFPLEILGAMVTGSAIFHALTSTIILVLAKVAIDGTVPYTIIWLPVVWLPLVLGCIGMTWILATAGVFMRDINQLMGSIVSIFMFLSPIFYPSSAVPQGLQWLVNINPLAVIVEQTRSILIEGIAPSAVSLIIITSMAIIWCEIAFRILKKSQSEFGDIL